MKDQLYELLLKKGVSSNHIKEMKETLNFNIDFFSYYFKEKEIVECEVPLSKIKSLGFRGSSGLSWYDHAIGKGSNIDSRRRRIALKHLIEQSLGQFQSFYKKSLVRLIYFKDLDFYAVYGDGTHRTLWAKLTGTSTISAEVIVAYKDHLAYESFKSDYNSSFIVKSIIKRLMKYTPNRIELSLLVTLRRIHQNNVFDKISVGLDLYYIEKVLSE